MPPYGPTVSGKVDEFRASLLEGQQPLGKEFERVLYDNLWDLYEETPHDVESQEQ